MLCDPLLLPKDTDVSNSFRPGCHGLATIDVNYKSVATVMGGGFCDQGNLTFVGLPQCSFTLFGFLLFLILEDKSCARRLIDR